MKEIPKSEMDYEMERSAVQRKRNRPKDTSRSGRKDYNRDGNDGGTCPLCGEEYPINLALHLEEEDH